MIIGKEGEDRGPGAFRPSSTRREGGGRRAGPASSLSLFRSFLPSFLPPIHPSSSELIEGREEKEGLSTHRVTAAEIPTKSHSRGARGEVGRGEVSREGRRDKSQLELHPLSFETASLRRRTIHRCQVDCVSHQSQNPPKDNKSARIPSDFLPTQRARAQPNPPSSLLPLLQLVLYKTHQKYSNTPPCILNILNLGSQI